MSFVSVKQQAPGPATQSKLIPINECFGPTIQGEGALIGRPTVFVRTGGCDNRCSWCDSLYAVLPKYRSTWTKMSAETIFAKVQELSPTPILITLSGGNPAMQPLGELIQLGKAHGYTFCLETQGSIAQPWFADLDYLTLSPKPPSSGMQTNYEKLSRCTEMAGMECQTVFKVVIFDDTDYAYAKDIGLRYPGYPLYLQVGNAQVGESFSADAILERYRWLIEKVIADRWHTVTVLPQLHTLLWGNQRGV